MKRVPKSDEEIIRAIRNSEPEGVNWVYKKYYPMIFKMVISNNGNEEDAKDLFQTGMIALFEKIRDNIYHRKSSLKTFFYSICRNQWLTVLKQQRGTPNFVDINRYEEVLEDVSIDEQEMPFSEILHALKKQFTLLDDNCKELLGMFYYQKLSMRIIAEKFGYANADSAKSQKQRCIQKLQGLMAPFRKIYQ